MRNRGDGAWTVYVVRRLSDASGRFLGLALGAMRLDYFEGFYRDLLIAPDGRIALWRQDGVLLVRFPPAEGAGGHYDRKARFGDMTADERRVVVSAGTLDGERRMLAQVRAAGWPVVVGVSRNMDAVLRPLAEGGGATGIAAARPASR